MFNNGERDRGRTNINQARTDSDRQAPLMSHRRYFHQQKKGATQSVGLLTVLTCFSFFGLLFLCKVIPLTACTNPISP